MLRFMAGGPEKDACQNCKFFIHYLSICWVNVAKNQPKICGGTYIEDKELSPCKAWKKGYEYVPDVTIEDMATGEYRIMMFKKIDPEAF